MLGQSREIAQRKFAALEGWRGVSAVFVAISHFGHGVVRHLGDAAFIRHSYLFVDFFFVLSGFVIAHAYADRLHDATDLRAFALRRIGRLWPLHAAVLVAWFRAQLILLANASLTGNVAMHAAFVTALRGLRRIFDPALPAAEPLSLGNLYIADLLCLAYVALAIAISAGTFRWIEEPWRRRFNG
ncbi:MAG TPA: acyltransferase family protein [Dongiaceae bacterium]